MSSDLIDASLAELLVQKINQKTKPLGALGLLEQLAFQIGAIQQTLTPAIVKPHIVVFAGDHGIAKTGLVNPYPQEVTAQMVLNFLEGGAAINVFCRQNDIALKVVDAGVNYKWPAELKTENFIPAKIGYSTKNYLKEPAMSLAEVERAINTGKQIVASIAALGCNTIGFGEMGIGNTSSAALLMSAILNMPIEECVGNGTGTDEEQLFKKKRTLQQVVVKHQATVKEGTDASRLLQCYGGFEIAMMTGAYLQAKQEGMVIVVDGFISTAALLVAQLINTNVLSNCIFAHTSGEQGHRKMLEYLKAQPLLELGLRLGEGTGAALAMPLLKSAVLFLNEMASFAEAGVSEQTRLAVDKLSK